MLHLKEILAAGIIVFLYVMMESPVIALFGKRCNSPIWSGIPLASRKASP